MSRRLSQLDAEILHFECDLHLDATLLSYVVVAANSYVCVCARAQLVSAAKPSDLLLVSNQLAHSFRATAAATAVVVVCLFAC